MSTLHTLLRDGQLDESGVALLYDTVETVARSRNYPPPDGQYWTREAIEEAAHDFLVGHRATERLVQLAIQATDDDSFARLLRTAVLNWMRDGARRTVVGRQMRRLKEVCADDSQLQTTEEGVRLKTAPDRSYLDPERHLVSAAAGVSVNQRRWRPDANREGPAATRSDTLAIVHAVLDTAQSRVSWVQLGRVFARRFDLNDLPAVHPLDALDARQVGEYERVDVSDQVAVIIDQLTSREREVLPFLDSSSRDAAQVLPYGHSSIATTQRNLKSFLQTVVSQDAEGQTIVAELLRRLSDR